MKIISFYLPQFHETEDNNKWWGEGFTDWVSARTALPLFKGHNQPRIPLNSNYYDLSDETADTLRWQVNLANKYGVDGFCIYHYWFAGKKELERPAEILLANSDIEIEYAFCWDSGSWKRTWALSDKEQEILIEQVYGDYDMWEEHFNYLLPFFKDPRYIKIDNKPVFHIYRSQIIDCLDSMKHYWDELAIKEGFDGIYLIVGDNEGRLTGSKSINAYYNYEPVHCFDAYSGGAYVRLTVACTGIKKRIAKVLRKQILSDKRDAEGMYRLIASDDCNIDKKVYLGTFVNYDDTPRRKEKGAIYINNRPEFFRDNLRSQINKSKQKGNEFVYINAWNEWGEGAFLEPDETYKYEYLQIIKEVREECGL